MKQARILVIEPDEIQQIGMRSALSTSGYRSAGTPSAAAAAKLLDDRFDLILIGPTHSSGEVASAAATLRAASVRPASIVALTALPDCMIGHNLSDPGAKPVSDLPGALEALTRFVRFAPARPPQNATELAQLVGDWAQFDRQQKG